ncbi:glycosyltransferase family 4 protein [Mesorhizobium loti]|uniref:glycosyltransferase family 4 protein n=1 Tax=Rhizobium loti TaxID=381 RepID=UPI0012BCA7B9|nr:glycosyltransferase family 4 protein [Mesorhizobium loti]
MKRRRLLFVGGSGDPGGLHVHTADVAYTAASLGFPVKIISVNRDYFSDLLPRELIDVEHIEGLSYIKLVLKPRRFRISRLLLWGAVLIKHPGHDIIFCRGAFAETPITELLMAKAAGRRIYTIEHSPLEFAWRAMFSKRRYGAVMNACVQRTIVVSSQLSEIATRTFGMAAEKLRVCLNWVDPIFVPPTVAQRRLARERLGLSDDVQAIGYLGRLGPEKNIDVLIDAFAAVRQRPDASNTVLIIAGDGWFRAEVERKVLSSQAADHIRLVGWQGDPREIYHALDVFVLASPIEGFPLSLMEAMATGLPCITHPMASTVELIQDGSNGFVSDISAARLLSDRLMEFLGADAATTSRLGQAAAQTIATRFSRNVRLKAVLEALDIPLDGSDLPLPFPRVLTYRGS